MSSSAPAPWLGRSSSEFRSRQAHGCRCSWQRWSPPASVADSLPRDDGIMLNEKREIKGTMTYINGAKYEGQWRNDKKN